ncbi:MAG: glycosyltransferase [Thiobacillus sp.]|nr:glycosyltransferase [Thiobacillus sp.]
MPPFVSVITVSYNAANTVAATLDSVRAQTWRPLESVGVDGGSNDGTRDIVARYADIAGSVVSEPDRGIYDAMNKGIALARGEILHFLNGDRAQPDLRRFVPSGGVCP